MPGELYDKKTYPFEFSTVEMPYESYSGVNVRLRYALILQLHFNLKIIFCMFRIRGGMGEAWGRSP